MNTSSLKKFTRTSINASAVAALAFFLSSGCRAVVGNDLGISTNLVNRACQESVARSNTSILYVCSNINDELLEKINANLNPSDKVLIIRSPGGEVRPAMALATSLQRRGIELVVDGFCISACAHVLFTAVDDARVLDGGVVAFHHTGAIINMFARRYPDIEQNSPATTLQSEEERFYRDEGVDVDFLYWPTMRLNPVCVGAAKSPRSSHAYMITQYNYYVPSRRLMEAARGRSFQGYWPASAQEAGDLLQRGMTRSVSVVYGSETAMSSEAVQRLRSEPLRRCVQADAPVINVQ